MKYGVLSKYRGELMGIAMISVMLFHAGNAGFAVRFNSVNDLMSLGFGGVDVFIFLSAMGITISRMREKREYSDFMKRRLFRIMPAYYAVMLPYTVLLIVSGDAHISSLLFNSTLVYYWTNCKGAFNWYVAGIMTFYAVAPFLIDRLLESKHKVLFTLTGVVLGLAISQLLVYEGYWWYTDVAYRIPIFFVGMLFGIYVSEGRTVKWQSAVLFAVLAAAGAVYLYFSKTVYRLPIGIQLPISHTFVFTTVPVCMFACFVFEHVKIKPIMSVLSFVGKNSLEIYLLNVSFFSKIDIVKKIVPESVPSSLFYLIILSANIILGWVLHKAIEAIFKKTA